MLRTRAAFPNLQFLSLSLLLAACSQRGGREGATFLIEGPREGFLSSVIEGFTVPEPTNLSEVNCVGVLVGYPGEPNPGLCYLTSGAVLPVYRYGGLVSYAPGSTSAVTVPDLLGDKMAHVVAVGFRSSDGQCMQLSPDHGPGDDNGTNYSEPYLLGGTQSFLRSGGQNEISLPINFVASQSIDDCQGPIFNSGDSLSNSLVAFWYLDANNGFDVRGNYMVSGSVTGSIGRNGSPALSFPGVSTEFPVSATSGNAQLELSNYKLSFSFWLKNDGSDMSNGRLFQKTSGGANGFYVSASSCNVTSCSINVYISNTLVTTCTNVDHDAGAHLVVTMERESGSSVGASIYKNGSLCSWASTGSAYASGLSEPFKFGYASGAAQNASIDNVGVWSRKLTATDANRLYNGGLGKDYPF
jgi:hypothetical protein